MEFNNKLVTLQDLNHYNNNLKYSIDNYVQVNISAVNKTISDNTTALIKQIDAGGTGLQTETAERKTADENLQKQITENKTIISEEKTIRDSQVKQFLTEAKEHTDTVIGDLNISIDGITNKYHTVTQAIASAVGMHNNEVIELLQQHETINTSIVNEYNRAKSREDSIESSLSSQINMVKTTADRNTGVVDNHLIDKNNPHGVTAEQLGAVKQEVVTNLTSRVSQLEEKNESNADSIIDNATDITKLKDEVLELKVNTLKNSGTQIINGTLQTSSDVIVGGDLTVKGTTKSVHQETITVSDNLLVLNDAKEDVSALLSGVVINTGNESYGIVYDGKTQSIKLGIGVVDINGDYKFIGNGNPILTRAEHNTFIDGNVVVWDATNKRVIDGGVRPTLESLGAASQLDLESLNNTVNSQGEFITELNSDYTIHKSDTLTRLSNLETGKQSVVDERLKTVNKTIYSAINEVHDEFDNHLIDKDNPHGVTIEQIGAEPFFEKNTAFNKNFSDIVPMENGNASAGSSETVSRSDHVHPTDISRAPVEHSSVDEIYGKATDTKYGHVKVDTSLNSGSTNPVASNIIQSEFANVRTQIESKVCVLTRSITEEQTRAVAKEIELNTLYEGLTARVQTEETTRQNADNTLSTRIAEEEQNRKNSDSELAEDLNKAKSTIIAKYDPVWDLYSTLNNVEIDQLYVLAFNTTDPTNPKPYFKKLIIDDGIID